MSRLPLAAIAAALLWLGYEAPRAACKECGGSVGAVLWVAYGVAFAALWLFHLRQAGPVAEE